MCIIVDAPLLVAVFKSSDPDHDEFRPVLEWIDAGSGKFVIGGSKYDSELRKVKTCIPVLMEFFRKGRVVKILTDRVDQAQQVVSALEPSADFDDAHLVALARVSGCKLIATRDVRAHKFLRKSEFYEKSVNRPKLYTRKKNSHLLCEKNCANCCR